ncbi:MAG TPA: glycine cleavage system protein T, partial [Candidatus Corynebacterium gallistercoris]|nr:glycine cleavage system protein T [Candidatus Corynebacterium gallistercoris]
PVAMAYVNKAAVNSGTAAEGATVEVDIRGKRLPFTVVKLPFYSREK